MAFGAQGHRLPSLECSRGTVAVPQCLPTKPQKLLSLDQDYDTSGNAPPEGLTHTVGSGGLRKQDKDCFNFCKMLPHFRAGTKASGVRFSQARCGFSVAEGVDTCLLSTQPETLSSQKAARGRNSSSDPKQAIGLGQRPAGRKAMEWLSWLHWPETFPALMEVCTHLYWLSGVSPFPACFPRSSAPPGVLCPGCPHGDLRSHSGETVSSMHSGDDD